MSSATFIDRIPSELIFQIFSESSSKDIKNFSLSSKSYRRILLPIIFRHIRLRLNQTELTTVFSAFKDGGSLAHIRSDVKHLTLYPTSDSTNAVIGSYKVFTKWVYLFDSLTNLYFEIYAPATFLDLYKDFYQRLFYMVFRSLEKDSPAYYTIREVSLKIQTLPYKIPARMILSELKRDLLDKECREYLGLPAFRDIFPLTPLTEVYFPPNLETLYFDYAPHPAKFRPLYPLSSILTARETLKNVYLNIVQENGNRTIDEYSFPDAEFPNVKTLGIHPHFLYDGGKLFSPLVRSFPNVENLMIYIAGRTSPANRLVYVDNYNSILLFPKVKYMRTFWLEEYDYAHGSEFILPWQLESEGIVRKWARSAAMLEEVVFARIVPKWRSDGTDMLEAIKVRVERVDGGSEVKCHWSDEYRAERLEFDRD
ncbi:hypothetical protein TWF506_010055 [Arthrobotrys conoides]|uniref:F-box domain-containing protein n=1 Tax=Arthrobotrys conoides TaxID=74498 RepID=A0AAN8NMD6_9PEZI